MVYDIDFAKIRAKSNSFLTYTTFLLVYDTNKERLTREFMQGGCFDHKNHLHITNGDYTIKGVIHNYSNQKGGISVFTIPMIPRTNVQRYYQTLRIASSNQDNGFRYQFNGTGEEPSGITFWDLSGKRVPGNISGCLHAIMIDNYGTGADDFFFKHYRRTAFRDIYYNNAYDKAIKMGVIITTEGIGDKHTTGEYTRRKENQELIAGLYKNRNIDYMIIENEVLDGVTQLIADIFAKSSKKDKCYIYINCHGGVGSLTLGYDDRAISFSSLRRVFNKIAGKQIILIDSCHSGSATNLKDPNSWILCSAQSEEKARGDLVLGNWATRYWVCGAGYDFQPGFADDMEADKNNDNKVTLRYNYTNRKLKNNSRLHTCVMISDTPDEVIFE